ncbi:MAG: hypothetical protein M3P12_05700 [Gemmatimonadota bacterium]|nr:hypothetical protein [Gemmatimonadota bacterium]
MKTGLVLLFFGAIWLGGWRRWHDSGLLPFGHWTILPGSPTWLRRIARSGEGELNAFALANEVWGVVVLVLGLVVTLGLWGRATDDELLANVELTLAVPIVVAGAYAAWRRIRAR